MKLLLLQHTPQVIHTVLLLAIQQPLLIGSLVAHRQVPPTQIDIITHNCCRL